MPTNDIWNAVIAKLISVIAILLASVSLVIQRKQYLQAINPSEKPQSINMKRSNKTIFSFSSSLGSLLFGVLFPSVMVGVDFILNTPLTRFELVKTSVLVTVVLLSLYNIMILEEIKKSRVPNIEIKSSGKKR